MALAWLAAYLLLLGAMDQLHNHDHPPTRADGAVAVSTGSSGVEMNGPAFELSPTEDPCPVLVLILSHAPAPAMDPPAVAVDSTLTSLRTWDTRTPLSLPKPDSRGPPFA